ncbi:MAG: hypothetical protein OHK0021_15420 [Bryobacter sp.]
MPFRRSTPITEAEAVRKLVAEIKDIESEKNKVGRYVLAIFAFVFIAAASLLAVIILTS